MGAGNSTSSKNVSKMMMKAHINIGTEIDQKAHSEAGGVNIVSQTCTNVAVKQPETPSSSDKDEKMKQLYESCFVAGFVGEKTCALQPPKGDSPPNIKWNGKSTYTSDYAKRIENQMNALNYCNESEANCKKCSSQGKKGQWSDQDPERCLTHYSRDGYGNMVKCGWLPEGELPSTIPGQPKISEDVDRVYCVPQCKATTSAGECDANPDCQWSKALFTCELAGSTLARFPTTIDPGAEVEEVVGCLMENIDQSNDVSIQATTMQDAAIQNVTKQDLQQNLKQVAIAMTKGISFGNSTSTANIGDMVANASTQISNKIKQECGAAGFGLNVVQQECDGVLVEPGKGGGAGCKISGVKQNNTMKIANECTQKAVVSNKVIQDLQQTMDQTAVAKNTGLDLTGFIIAYAIVAIVVVYAVFKFYSATLESGQKMLVYILPAVVVAAGVAMHAVAFFRNGGRYGWKRSFYDYHSGPNEGNYTIATMNMVAEKDAEYFKHYTAEGAPIGPKCFNLDTEKVIEAADTEGKCDAEDNGFWDETGHEGIDIAIAACAKGKSSRDCRKKSTDFGQCEWREPKDGEDAKCVVSNTDKGFGNAGRCFNKKDDITAAAADAMCHADGKCDAWFWKANADIGEMTAYNSRSRCLGNPDMKSKKACEDDNQFWYSNPENIYLWKDGYEDPWLDVAGSFSPDCWGDKVCCDKKDCFTSGDPLSEACKGCCPSGYTATLIGKTGSGCAGGLYNGTTDDDHCTSHEHADYDVKCSRCMDGKEAAQGTAYFYQQSPDQRTRKPYDVANDTQEQRVTSVLSCKAGITSWGGFVQDRSFDLVGISGCALWALGLAVVSVIGLMHLLHAAKNAIKELGKQAPAK